METEETRSAQNKRLAKGGSTKSQPLDQVEVQVRPDRTDGWTDDSSADGPGATETGTYTLISLTLSLQRSDHHEDR